MFLNRIHEFSASQGNAELLSWLFENSPWVDLYTKYALPEAVRDDILDIFNAASKEWKTEIYNIITATGMSADLEVYASCPGRMAFVPQMPKIYDFTNGTLLGTRQFYAFSCRKPEQVPLSLGGTAFSLDDL